MQNAYIERLNRLFREDVLNAYLFDSLEKVRILADKWVSEYNQLHPHKTLNGRTPSQAAIEMRGASRSSQWPIFKRGILMHFPNSRDGFNSLKYPILGPLLN
jgi:Integrase core domain